MSGFDYDSIIRLESIYVKLFYTKTGSRTFVMLKCLVFMKISEYVSPMRYIFPVFLIISLLVHVVIIGYVKLDEQDSRAEKPIEVSIIPKEKMRQPEQSLPDASPQPYQRPDYKSSPLDEKLEADVKEKRPALEKKSSKMPEKKEGGKIPQRTVPVIPEKKVSEQQKPEPPKTEQNTKTDANLPKMSDVPKKDIPAEGKSDKDKIKDILNPKDVIEKYANGGGELTGEDTVSMQYVKMRYQSYFHKFARRLYQVWEYPPAAGMRGESGTVRASFMVGRDGKISSIRIIHSSGYPDLDNEVIIALKKMSGVPLPESYSLNNLTVDAYFMYIIGGGFQIY